MSFRVFTLMLGAAGALALAACKTPEPGGTVTGTGGAGTGGAAVACPSSLPQSQDSCTSFPAGMACAYDMAGADEFRSTCTCSGTTHTWSCCLDFCRSSLEGYAGTVCPADTTAAAAYAKLIACAKTSCAGACGSFVAGQVTTQDGGANGCFACLSASCSAEEMACQLE